MLVKIACSNNGCDRYFDVGLNGRMGKGIGDGMVVK